MAIYRTDEDYAKRAALAKALREYADVVEQGAPIASSVYWAAGAGRAAYLPSSLHITLEQISITGASFWRAAIVPYCDPNALAPQFVERLAATLRPGAEAGEALKRAFGSWYADGSFPFSSEDTATEQQAAYSTPPPWRDRLRAVNLMYLNLAEAWSLAPANSEHLFGDRGDLYDTIWKLSQILDERE